MNHPKLIEAVVVDKYGIPVHRIFLDRPVNFITVKFALTSQSEIK